MGYHLIKEGQDLLMHELRQYLHALSSGKHKMDAKTASTLALMLQQLEMAKLFKALESAGGIEKVLQSLMGGGGHQKHQQIGFGHQYPMHSRMPDKRWQPMMDRYDTRSDYPHSDMDRYDIPHSDMDISDDYDEMMDIEMARRGRRGRVRRGGYRDRRLRRNRPRYEMDGDMRNDLEDVHDDLRYDLRNDIQNAMEMITRYANPQHRADTRTHNDMRTTGDMPQSDGTRSEQRSPMR